MKIYKSEAEVNEAILKQLQGQEKTDFEKGLKDLGLPGSELRVAFKKLLPNKSDREIDIMVDPDKYK
jgi:hypothetical protein